jgi:hypothetical protein
VQALQKHPGEGRQVEVVQGARRDGAQHLGVWGETPEELSGSECGSELSCVLIVGRILVFHCALRNCCSNMD